jgi:hypothetical protein
MDQLQNNLTLAEMEQIIHGAPKFILESISQDETMYNLRTKKYIERGISRALIQLDEGEEYFYTTMPYHSSFYDECVLLNDLREQILNIKKPD